MPFGYFLGIISYKNIYLRIFYSWMVEYEDNVLQVFVVEFEGHSLNQWVGYVSVWVPGVGGVVWSHPFCLCNTSCAIWVCAGPSFLQQKRYEWGRVIFFSLSPPNCYWEGWVNFFLISFPIVPISQIKALSLPSFVLQLHFPITTVANSTPFIRMEIWITWHNQCVAPAMW